MIASIKKFLRDYGWAYLFVAVPMLVFLAFTVYPVIYAIIMSFQKYNVFGSTWVGFKNYRYVLTDNIFWKALKVTLLYTIGTVPVNIAISLMLSWMIFQLSTRFQTFFKAAFYLPVVASGVTTSLVWLWIFDPQPHGLLNQFLGLFGFDNVIWLGRSSTALFSLMLMSYLSGHGSSLILYLSAMGGIPKSLYEAADVDATSTWGKFKNITWPLLKPTTLYLLVTGIIGSFQVFQNIMLMTEGGPNFATTTVAYLIFNTAFNYFDFGAASAMAFVLTVIILTLSVIQFKYFSSDVEY